ncbi:DUF2207 domain-containing protein [Stappia sp.]|uniref:DUF2207 domain-containing protein n=1 Tax=Stappia sp. TaxID=1870903 RepID=UPI003A9A2B8E
MRLRNLPALVAGWLAVLILCFAPPAAQADERILAFNSTVEVASGGEFTVTETIRVRAEGSQIRRGIYRDIPLAFERADGSRAMAGFDLVSIRRDGEEDGYTVNRGGSGVRVYIGREDVFLSPGTYTYTIVYRTDRQVRFFDGHDEVYWNATGNEWNFPIDKAVARVVLPEGATAKDYSAYTGAYGATGRDFTARVEDGGRSVLFASTRVLAPGEGLTVNVEMAKGVVAEPTTEQELGYFLSDHFAEILGGLGLVLVLGYYLWVWRLVGRDPPKGVIFPRFEGPEGISPALSNYVVRKGFGDGGWRALSAACISLAVKGRLVLEDLAGDLKLTRPEGALGDYAGLANGEKAIARWLDGREGRFTVSKANGTAVKSLGSTFRGAIEGENRNRFFKANTVWLVPGVALSVVTIFALLAFGKLSDDQIAVMIPIFMVTFVVVMFTVQIGKVFHRSRSTALRVVFTLVIFGFITMGHLVGAAALLQSQGAIPPLALIAVALLAVNILFYFLIGAPTALGRTVMDEIEGLKMYLEVAEKDRMNMKGAPRMSPSHFETLLPYAVALDVEKPWSKAFETWLLTAAGAAAATAYAPAWYSGRAFDSHDVSGSLGDTLGAMSGTFTSSLPAPKSSSSGGGGGGFSGGGGGGGGGGGW